MADDAIYMAMIESTSDYEAFVERIESKIRKPMQEKKFIDGLRVFKPRDNAPEWIQANGVINNKELIAYLQARLNAGEENTRFDIKLSKGGKFYAELNDWKPNQQTQQTPQNAPGWPPQEFVPPPTPERQPPPVDNSFDIGDIPF